jgi:hypothetical protein
MVNRCPSRHTPGAYGFTTEKKLIEVLGHAAAFLRFSSEKNHRQVLSLQRTIASLLKEIGFLATDQHRVTNAAASYLLGRSAALIEYLINLKNQSVFPPDKARMEHTLLIHIQIDRDIGFPALYAHVPHSLLRITGRTPAILLLPGVHYQFQAKRKLFCISGLRPLDEIRKPYTINA